MKRREFLGFSATVSVLLASVSWSKLVRAEGKKLTEKDILKEGQKTTIVNYCETPDKQPNKFCPSWATAPNKGHCETCMFYNKDKSESDFKGKKYARCSLLTDASKPQFVGKMAWCATYAKQA